MAKNTHRKKIFGFALLLIILLLFSFYLKGKSDRERLEREREVIENMVQTELLILLNELSKLSFDNLTREQINDLLRRISLLESKLTGSENKDLLFQLENFKSLLNAALESMDLSEQSLSDLLNEIDNLLKKSLDQLTLKEIDDLIKWLGDQNSEYLEKLKALRDKLLKHLEDQKNSSQEISDSLMLLKH